MYFPSAYNLNVRPKSIAEFSEHNFLTYFNYNPEKIHAHCYSETYDKFLGFKTQTRPDAILNFKYSPFSFKGYIAIDMKTARSPGLGRSEAIAEINVNAYKKLLDRFESHLVQLKYFTPEIEFLFKRMQENVEDFTSLQNYWFKCVTLLEHTGNIPPLRIPEAFNTKYLLPEQLARYNKAKNKLLAVSELLYKKKISEHYQHPSLPERALDIFEGSEMQNILND